ncbi:hypothetical protein AYI68_g48 [Smittium mucronatum]|uniref:Uncharacterized protein n=1 Tax=Smittium mucronatum TaxID=133383 RepID=A0A1R0H991_9FUNG|nr:hypothetical protein AYI68_g48 [Smittium mucronatum]
MGDLMRSAIQVFKEDGFYPQFGSDPFHGGRITKIGNQSDRFVDFGLDRLDSGFAHAKGIASVAANMH